VSSRPTLAAGVLAIGLLATALAGQAPAGDPPWQLFLVAAGSDRRAAREAFDAIAARWRDGYAAMFLDVARLLPPPRPDALRDEQPTPGRDADPDSGSAPFAGRFDFAPANLQPRGADTRRRIIAFLEQQTGRRFGDDLLAGQQWLWARPYAPHPDYAAFKAALYGQIDPAFETFFPERVKSAIRLDEIDWGGVRVNGIPPLRSPRTITATAAKWLRDGHVVFGVEVNGEARAYPKRILAWHEMATDRLGGLDLTIVYCTLCGTVIPYLSDVNGRRFTFGTSGLLYRSNKLMFDEETRSLWSSLEGRPVVGPLVDSGLQLAFTSAVTTTWGEWRREHPATTVLSLDTGFDRDYAEGAAYRDYFGTDRLMFEVPGIDARLKNKAEVLVLRRELIGPGARAVAVFVDRLKREPVFNLDAGGRAFVVVTSKDGANRVYERGTHSFARRDPDGHVRDSSGHRWRVTAEALVSDADERLPRVPAHRAFWFGWRAQYPDTELLK